MTADTFWGQARTQRSESGQVDKMKMDSPVASWGANPCSTRTAVPWLQPIAIRGESGPSLARLVPFLFLFFSFRETLPGLNETYLQPTNQMLVNNFYVY